MFNKLSQTDKTKLKRKVKTTIKAITAALFVILTLAITYLPNTPSWDDIYAAVGLKETKLGEIPLKDLTIVFLDVGQGDCEIIKTEDTSILIDTGPSGNAQKIRDALNALNIRELDYLIITHQHDDHMGSLYDLRKLIKINNEIIPDPSAKMAGLSLTLQANENEELLLQFLAPIYVNDSLNNMSLVIKLTYKDTSCLFMADAEEEEEGTLLRTYDAETLHADVLKVGHHGSDSSSTKPFIDAVGAKYAVISVGADNDYGHPSPEVLRNLAPAVIHRTDRDGTILCTTDGATLTFHRLE
ncbi:MAG: MBL fold metallo-hydrolase [Clostridia bacterium]|nr:MBL fold metallo-hydrolase [Clostridia bacterium]